MQDESKCYIHLVSLDYFNQLMTKTSYFKGLEVINDEYFSYKFVNEKGLLCLRQINKTSENSMIRGTANQTFNFSIKVVELLNDYLEVQLFTSTILNFSFTIAKCSIGQYYQEATRTCFDCPSNFYSFEENFQESTSCSPCSTEPFNCYGGFNLSPKPGYWRAGDYSRNFIKCKPYGKKKPIF